MISFRRTAWFVFAFFLASPSVLHSQSQDPKQAQLESLQKKLDSVLSQVADIQTQMKELQGNAVPSAVVPKATLPTQNPPGASAQLPELNQDHADISNVTATYDIYDEDPISAARVDNEPLDPGYPGFFRLPGTRTFLRIGGFARSDFIYDLKPAGAPDLFVPASIPIPAPANVNNSTISIRPTRLNLDFLVPTDVIGTVRFFIEGDLFGVNATAPRVRHAYAQIDNILIGQTFSTFMDPDSGTDQLDFQGPNARITTRNPQIRYTLKVHPKTTFAIAAERPTSDIAFTVAGFEALPNSPSPDGILQFRREMNDGHVQIAAVFRSISGFLRNGATDSVFGWGFSGGGAQRLFDRDMVVYQIAYGNGIERYINDTAGLGIDAALNSAANPYLKALPVVATYGGYQHFWTSKLRSSLVYGFVQVQNTDFQPGSVFHQSNYSAANLIWNPIGSLNVGAEFLYGWRVNKDGSSGNAPRIMFSARYNFVRTQPMN